MLVSHTHKFIYIKPKKTAGTSIQEYLEPYCKKDGIIKKYVPHSHMGAEKVIEIVGEETWNSYLKILPVRNPWDKMVSLYFWRRNRKRPILTRIRRVYRGKPWKSPAETNDFKDFIKELFDQGKANIDKHIIYVNDQLPDYHYIKYESLLEDLEKLCTKLDIPWDPSVLPNKKGGIRKEKGYQQLYDDESKDWITQAYQLEIDKFGYQF